jgi:hypothetical protein
MTSRHTEEHTMNPIERAIARTATAINEADRLAGLPPRYQNDVTSDDLVTVVSLVADEGTVVVFGCDDGRRIGVDHRVAADLADRLSFEGEVSVAIEPWQVL